VCCRLTQLQERAENEREENRNTCKVTAKIIGSLQKRDLSRVQSETMEKRGKMTGRGPFLLREIEADGKIYEPKNPFE
jgi:hypothetical protein